MSQQGEKSFFQNLRGAALVWYLIFIGTGMLIGNVWAFLDLHAGPAEALTFLTAFISYWFQLLVGGTYALSVHGLKGFRWELWTKKMVMVCVISGLFDGGSQALDYIAKIKASFMIYTIFHSSVVFFSALMAFFILKAKVSLIQWSGVILVLVGVWIPVIPFGSGDEDSTDFLVGLVCSAVGAAMLAASYPFSEMVFSSQPPEGERLSEEVACAYGSLVNVVIYTIWTLAFTVPHWQCAVINPIFGGPSCDVGPLFSYKYPMHRPAPEPSGGLAVTGYLVYGVIVGLHALSFWKSVNQVGTVATAVSKGVQQAGNFVFPSLIFCGIKGMDRECLNWNYPGPDDGPALTEWHHIQRPIAGCLCVLGVVVYGLGKESRTKKEAKTVSLDGGSHLSNESKSGAALGTAA